MTVVCEGFYGEFPNSGLQSLWYTVPSLLAPVVTSYHPQANRVRRDREASAAAWTSGGDPRWYFIFLCTFR